MLRDRVRSFVRHKQQKLTNDGTVSFEALAKLRRDQGFRCANFRRDYIHQRQGHKLVLDHIIPLVRGGAHTISNVQWLCEACNRRKMISVPSYVFETRTLLRHPSEPDVSETVFMLLPASLLHDEDISYEQ